jgi:transposase
MQNTTDILQPVFIKQGLSVGALFTVFQIAQRLNIVDVLGINIQGKIALWQICARVLEQGSRLSATRMIHLHAANSILQFENFSENDLYDNLKWLAQNQKTIENDLFTQRCKQKAVTPNFFLYDITSSCFEEERNKLARFGYNDKKKGKLQIIIGLLCDNEGVPVSIEVFEDNTLNPQIVVQQIKKIRERFGCGKVTLIGDRGLLKRDLLKNLKEVDFCYIRAIAHPQVETLIEAGVLDYGLFDKNLCEVEWGGIRYIFRRDPAHAGEIEHGRKVKLKSVKKLLDQQNAHLSEHSQAEVSTSIGQVWKMIEQLKIEQWLSVSVADDNERCLQLTIDDKMLSKLKRLDGCYVLKTNVSKELSPKEEIHDRYKDLSLIENAFQTCKTVSLEIPPFYGLSSSTTGHIFMMMLAYMIIQELNQLWKGLEVTVGEGLTHLSTLTETCFVLPNGQSLNRIPEPTNQNAVLLKAARIQLPACLQHNDAVVCTHSHLKK